MIPNFYPRPGVQNWLHARLSEVQRAGTGRLLAIRGRRQAGKSTVVERFVEESDVPYVYMTGIFGMPAGEQLAAAYDAQQSSRRPLATDFPSAPTTWNEWFTRLALAATSGPVIVVLDEFPWLKNDDNSGLEGTLQATWDRVLEKLPVLLILIGSDVAMMERLAQHDRPLYGRIREFVVPMLTPGEVASVFPNSTPTEIFDHWLITGGYPRLVTELRDADAPLLDWVHQSFTDEFSPLVATARLNLSTEFGDSPTASRVLSAIGSAELAHLPLGKIVDAITVSDDAKLRKTTQTAVVRALHTLTDEKRLVITDLPAWARSTRSRRYRVTDPYLRFWFRYVERYQGTIARGRSDLAIAAFDHDWQSWRGRAIEPIVRESLLRLAAVDPRLDGVEMVQAWWTRDGQHEIDVVAGDRERTSLLGTIKWREHGGVTDHEMHELAAVRSRVPRSESAQLVAISPSGEAVDAQLTFSAADLLRAWTTSD